MSQDQIVEIGKALLPYLRADLKPEELGTAAHDAFAALSRTGGRGELVKRAAMIERERIATFIEGMDDGPLTTKAVKSYIAAEVRRQTRDGI